MNQQFVNRLVGSVCRLKPPPPGRAPSVVVFRHVPLEYDLNTFSGRNLRRDLRRNGNLAVWREFAFEVSSLHLNPRSPIISRVRTMRVRTRLRSPRSNLPTYVQRSFTRSMIVAADV